MATFAALLIDGIAYGMMLFLISAGLTVTLGVMRVVNLSHSAFAMIGGYLALWAMKRRACRSGWRCRWPCWARWRSAWCWSARCTAGSMRRIRSGSC